MVVCVETPYYELGFAGLQVEDMVRVTKDGAESLMTLNTALRIRLTRALGDTHEILGLPGDRI